MSGPDRLPRHNRVAASVNEDRLAIVVFEYAQRTGETSSSAVGRNDHAEVASHGATLSASRCSIWVLGQ